MAVSYQLPYIVEILLENGANVNTQSTTGQTPIVEAVLQGENAMVEMLIRRRADVTIPDNVSFGCDKVYVVERMLFLFSF